MGPSVRLQSGTARALGALMVAASALGLGSVLVGDLADAVRYAAPLVLFGLLGWAAFWRPFVEVGDGGVTVANTLRTTEVPWPMVESVEGRYGLRLETSCGRVTAWAAAAPAGRQRARGEESAAARTVRDRLAAVRATGCLDDARLEHRQLLRVWDRPLAVAVLGLILASVLLPLLG